MSEAESASGPVYTSEVLDRILRDNRLTTMEITILEARLKQATCKELADAAASEVEAMTFAELAGISSTAAQEHVGRAWRDCMLVCLGGGEKLLRQLLEAYHEEKFQMACRELNREWRYRATAPMLEAKMHEIEALCLKHVLALRLLPLFGFSSDARGMAEMKAAISRRIRACPELRQLHLDTSAAVMSHFQL